MVECSFLELKCKDVINVVDGKRLGRIVDVVFDLHTGCLLGFIVPGIKNFFSFFKGGNEIYIPFSQVCKIGADTILVEIYGNQEFSAYIQDENQPRNIRN